jgi:hypothetical protein
VEEEESTIPKRAENKKKMIINIQHKCINSLSLALSLKNKM